MGSPRWPLEKNSEGTSVLLTKGRLCGGWGRGRPPPPPAGLGPGLLCQCWLCFSFTPGGTNANPVWLCWPENQPGPGNQIREGESWRPRAQGRPGRRGCPLRVSPPGDGHQGAPKTLERLFSLDIENHSCRLPLGSDRGSEMDLFSVVIKVIGPTFIDLDYPGTMDIKDN